MFIGNWTDKDGDHVVQSSALQLSNVGLGVARNVASYGGAGYSRNGSQYKGEINYVQP